jgi:protease I
MSVEILSLIKYPSLIISGIDLVGKKVLLIIAPQNFRDEELLHTKEELERVGAKTTIASTKTGEVRGMLGARVTPDIKLDQVKVDDYDVVVFVGGSGSAVYFDDKQAISIASEAFSKGKKVCAICIAPVILANAGVLKGKRATAFPDDSVPKIKSKGATYTGKSVEVDGNIITANGPAAAREFGRTIARELTR